MTRLFKAAAAVFFGIALFGLPHTAKADALDDIMKAKVIKVAVPQDFAPFGSAGLISSRSATTSTWRT